MKKYNILFSAVFALAAFIGCTDDKEPVYEEGTKATSAEFIAPSSGRSYVLTEEMANNTFEVYEWNASDFGVPVGMNYTVQLDLEGNNFEKPYNLVVTPNRMARISVADMNKAVVDGLKVSKIESVALKMRIMTKAFGGEGGDMLLTGFPTTYSAEYKLSVTPYIAIPEYPENVYMIGADFGAWNWESSGIVDLKPVNGKEGVFWTVNYFQAGQGFKWCAKKAWGEDFPELAEKEGYTVSDGNAFVAEDGMYMVLIDYISEKITISKAKVYGIGDCFGGWNEAKYPFSIEGNKVTITTTSAGELRMYAAIEGVDAWRSEFMVFDGKLAYRGNSGDQDRVIVQAGKTVTLDFNAGTGEIK